MKKILVLGASGMAGHTIALYLLEQGYDVSAFTRSSFNFPQNIIGDARDLDTLVKTIKSNKYDVVINCVGILNTAVNDNLAQGIALNSLLPHYLSNAFIHDKIKIIHMSTDCVFSGKKGNYTENDYKDGDTFYDKTKALGELNDNMNLTFRNSIIGLDLNPKGIGLFNWFMKQKGEIAGYSKSIWTGVTTLTLAKAIEKAIECDLTGLYHLVNNTTISKYELLKLFNHYFKDDLLTILENNQISVDKSLLNTRDDFDFVVPSYEQMLKEMKAWLDSHKDLYQHY